MNFIIKFLICFFYSSCQTSIVNEGAHLLLILRTILFRGVFCSGGGYGGSIPPWICEISGAFLALSPPPLWTEKNQEDAPGFFAQIFFYLFNILPCFQIKELSLFHKLRFSNHYIFATLWYNPFIFHTRLFYLTEL